MAALGLGIVGVVGVGLCWCGFWCLVLLLLLFPLPLPVLLSLQLLLLLLHLAAQSAATGVVWRARRRTLGSIGLTVDFSHSCRAYFICFWWPLCVDEPRRRPPWVFSRPLLLLQDK